jgi:hypothetical protein
MSGEVSAAVIAGSTALVVALVTAYLTVVSAHKQRSLDLLTSALGDMESGTQRRSAAIAALEAMRGRRDDRLSRLDRALWRQYGPAVGQQLFRVLAYVLNHAEVTTHGTENAIAMTDWVVGDPLLEFNDPDQRGRLATSLAAYDAKLKRKLDEGTAASAFHGNLDRWRTALNGPPVTK